MSSDQPTPDDSSFRRWFRDCLKALQGNTVEWPVLLRQVLEDGVGQLRTSDQYYAGAVFRNRDKEVEKYRACESQDEEILVYRLYRTVHEKCSGVLSVGDMPVWLFSFCCEKGVLGVARWGERV